MKVRRGFGRALANRYFTFMVIPERSSRVKKWIVPVSLIRWTVLIVAVFVLGGLVTSFMTLRYVAKKGEFQQALLKSHYLEGRLHFLQNKLHTADSTLVRIQNFEQKLRVLVQLDTKGAAGGIGPITEEEERILRGEGYTGEGTLVASLEKSSPEYAFKTRSLEKDLDSLGRKATLQEQSLQELYELLKDQKTMLSSTPSIWPTRGWVTSGFGYRISPFTGLRQLHAGIDVAAQTGTQVLAPADGIVTRVGTEEGYGKVISVNHGYGIVTRYGHNSKIRAKVGQRIKRGNVISEVGSTGRSTAPHLHYEIRVNGIPVNPMRYIFN